MGKRDKIMIIDKVRIEQFGDVRLFYHSLIDGMQSRIIKKWYD